MSLRFNPQLIVAALIFSALLVVPVSVQAAGNLVPGDILRMEEPGHFTLSPDGGNLVYIKSSGTDLAPPQGNGTLMYINVQSGEEVAISAPGESATFYALSPDGNQVIYSAMPREGGASTLTLVNLNDLSKTLLKNTPDELAGGYSWIGNERLLYTGAPAGTAPPPGPGDVIVVDATPDPVILKTYSLKDGTIAPLSNNTDVITIWAPSPDGRYVLYKASTNPEAWQVPATFRYVLLDTNNGQERQILQNTGSQDQDQRSALDTGTGQEQDIFSLVEGFEDTNEFAWSPDSSVVYIERMQNGGLKYPVEYTSDLLAYTPASGTLDVVPLNWERGLLIDLFNSDIEVNPYNGGAYVLLGNGTNPELARVSKNGTGWNTTLLTGEHQGNIFAVETDRTGMELVYNYNSAESPPQLIKATVADSAITGPVQITDLNRDLLKKPLGSAEVTSWTGARGDTIEGVIRYPPGYVKGRQYPLVLVIHGGPNYADFDSWRDTWEFPYHLITDKGAVTLSVNYHGSTNFGFDFARSIEGGHYYDYPVQDLEAGIDHLANLGIINRSQVGVTGWSNGGILTLALITKDPTLKAAISGAGTADEISQVANLNGIMMDKMYYNQTPYQDPAGFIPILPVYNAKDVKTPLLMMIGTKDNAVVPSGAWVSYRAYKEGSQAPVRFILFKDEPHHLNQYGDQLRKVEEELDWLDQYLFR